MVDLRLGAVSRERWKGELILQAGPLRTGSKGSSKIGVSKASAVSKGFRIKLARAGRGRLGQHNRLAGQFKPLAAFAAGDQLVHAHHVGARLGETRAVLVTRAAGQLLFFRPHHPADRVAILLAAMRADEGEVLGFLLFGVVTALIHGSTELALWQSGVALAIAARLVHCNKLQAGTPPARQPVLQRAQHVLARATQSSMVTVV